MPPNMILNALFVLIRGYHLRRYMLILTQTQKKHSCQIFTNISAGFFRTTVTVLQMHLQYCDSSPEEASRYVGENLTRMFLLCLC